MPLFFGLNKPTSWLSHLCIQFLLAFFELFRCLQLFLISTSPLCRYSCHYKRHSSSSAFPFSSQVTLPPPLLFFFRLQSFFKIYSSLHFESFKSTAQAKGSLSLPSNCSAQKLLKDLIFKDNTYYTSAHCFCTSKTV